MMPVVVPEELCRIFRHSRNGGGGGNRTHVRNGVTVASTRVSCHLISSNWLPAGGPPEGPASTKLFRPNPRSPRIRTNLLSTPHSGQQVSPARRHGVIRPRELIVYQHLCFFRRFNEANRNPRRATPASTKPSKPVRPHTFQRTRNE